MARKNKLAAALLTLGCLNASSVWALGLGELTLESFLNEPLKAQVDLLNTGGLQADEIRIRLATSDDFERMGVDRAYFLTGIKFDVQVDQSGRGVIVVTSDDPVLEPYLDFIVEARWPSGRLLREYTVLVDPPAFDTVNPVVSASQRVAEIEGEPEPAKKATDPAATSGTRVKTSASNLAPGEMPNRDFGSSAASNPTAGARYMVKRDQTLWEIASQGRPAGTSVHQAMLDIQRLNPEAFINGNINQIKAGYIIYLPSADDISSDNLADALAEVRQQNADWQASRDTAPGVTAAASLRISAEPVAAMEQGGDSSDARATSDASMEALERAQLEAADSQGRLDAMSERVDTLERIVDLKDEQIAALQAALAEANGSSAVVPETDTADLMADGRNAAVEGDQTMAGDPQTAEGGAEVTEAAQAAGGELAASAVDAAPEEAATATPEPVAVPKAAPAKPTQITSNAPAQQGGIAQWMYIAGGAVVALLLGLILWRRRSGSNEAVMAPTATQAQPVAPKRKEVVAPVEPAPEPEPEPEVEVESAPVAETPSEDDTGTGRGYGEKRHDEYASEGEAGDAVAEADIYIAYGRQAQAVELLKTAIGNEPGNMAYRLRLLELYVDMGDRDEAAGQLTEIRASGDTAMIAAAESVMGSGRSTANLSAAPAVEATSSAPAFEEPDPVPTVGNPAGGSPAIGSPADFDDTVDPEVFESDFGGLEIEDSESEDMADDLDLSGDFEADEGDMVFAAEGNQMSTKLDLARAYMDMGDGDGARQILEEVMGDGTEEQQEEARQLLARID